ncbi:ABC transporter substrate-binding protein [Pontibacillus halophilus JSM 076056 = DSM 19796]|uniref:ABC transporter substrate-binding protein n=1 Tax=Pontibacillus halophilus JSM 076056 = DSM 19796 TaxID=1385510 RepID=A0A0A5GI06_9BACI|nr:transporter substrate-binding domain-containing protein [Pontibacillus halophilus]KGX92881.1 ABC transporter substrate-binding protein [Pontibacillus halophilus JSM 076056 = DSM 19796]
MKKGILYTLMMMTLLVVAACGSSVDGQSSEDKKKLVMGTSADYKPYEFIDTDQSEDIIGFDIDIANHIADELGYELEVRNMDFNGLVAALNSNKVDFVISGMTPTEKRKEQVDFSDIYYVAKDAIVFNGEDGYKELSDLEGKTVGVQLGSIQEELAKDLEQEIDGLKIKSLDTIPNLVQELKAGRIDATIIENTVSKGYLEANDGLGQFEVNDQGEQGSAIAFPQGNDELVQQFNEEISNMKESGKMDELIQKWFGEQ